MTPYDLSRLNTPYLNDSSKRITVKGLDGCSSHLLPAGSIVMSSRAPIGYVAIPTVEFCTNQGCKSIQLKDNFASEFTYYNILFNIDKVKNLGEGTTFAEISNFQVALPDEPEQNRMATLAKELSTWSIRENKYLSKLRSLKTALMQDLLTGKKRVTALLKETEVEVNEYQG